MSRKYYAIILQLAVVSFLIAIAQVAEADTKDYHHHDGRVYVTGELHHHHSHILYHHPPRDDHYR